MLILTRRIGESIVISEHITVTVLAVKGEQVRIGVQAPSHIAVNRSEVHARILAGDTTANPHPSPD
jgi:carbon storage regulator